MGSGEIAIPDELQQAIEQCGFDYWGVTDPSAIRLREEIRATCKSNTCRMYGKCWACPPACGELDYYRELFATKTACIVLQSMGVLDNKFDYKGMMAVEQLQNDRLDMLADLMEERGIEGMMLGTGGCRACETCAYPDPCVFPKKLRVSLEACGAVVSEVCIAAGVDYYHGPGTMAFVGALII